MKGIQYNARIAVTGPATLWQAPEDRIVRTIDPRYCDEKFRVSLGNLKQRPFARMIRIECEGWSGVQYCVQYSPGSSCEPLATHFQRLHWRLRLKIVKEICDAVMLWHSGPVHPLGLNLYNVVMVKDAGRWFPWLLPCPPLDYTSPCDLFGADPTVIGAIDPEVIRGVSSIAQAQDMYALGVLAIYALGCQESLDAVTDEERIEAQVCGAFLPCDITSSDVESFLQGSEVVQQLVRVIRRYTHISPDARPKDASDLAAACVATFEATDSVRLAHALAARRKLQDAHRILEWGFKHFGNTRPGRLLAADICEQLEEFPRALQHIEVATALMSEQDPGDLVRRVHLRWKYIWTLSTPDPDGKDTEGDLLLQDLEILKRLPAPMLERRNLPYFYAGQVYRRRRDLARAVHELYQAANLEHADLFALWCYAETLRDLGHREEATQAVEEGQRRIGRMVMNQLLSPEEGREWHGKFSAL